MWRQRPDRVVNFPDIIGVKSAVVGTGQFMIEVRYAILNLCIGDMYQVSGVEGKGMSFFLMTALL